MLSDFFGFGIRSSTRVLKGAVLDRQLPMQALAALRLRAAPLLARSSKLLAQQAASAACCTACCEGLCVTTRGRITTAFWQNEAMFAKFPRPRPRL